MRLVVTGGGTGGHIYPALAVAEHFRGEAEVLYIGKTDGMEQELATAQGFEFKGIRFYGMPRGKSPLLPFQLLKWGMALSGAVRIARKMLREYQPHVVFGTGGYVSAPVLMAAASLKIPYVIHEPDAKPGLVNQLMAKSAAAVTTSFSEGGEQLSHDPHSSKVRVTGNPIRGEIGKLSKAEALQTLGLDWPADALVLMVTGGSQGARRINTAVVEALPTLLGDYQLYIIHQTGRKLYDETRQLLAERHPTLQSHANYHMAPYFPEMAAVLGAADVAVCRAGSLSLSELYVCGIPTILIPYPFAAADHQTKNAQASVKAGASVMIRDAECSGARLAQALGPMVKNPDTRNGMRQAALALGHPHATAAIAQCLRQSAQS